MNWPTRIAIALVLSASTLPSPGRAHELDRRTVEATLEATGRLRVEAQIHAAPTLRRLELLDRQRRPSPENLEALKRRLEGKEHRLRQLVALRFDGVDGNPDFELVFLEPPRDGTEIGAGSELHPAIETPPVEAVLRYTTFIPAEAEELTLLYSLPTSAYNLVIRVPDQGRVESQWLDIATWSAPIALTGVAPTAWSTAKQYLRLGFQHILPLGADHILFVLGIFLFSPRIRPMLVQVTAFTLAHTLTLGLSIYGVVSLPASVVEPLIALSIVYVGIENLWSTRLRGWRVALVFGFGLLHGLGFAGVLQELGLPRSQFLTALVSFNLGVELGQLAVLGVALLLVASWAQHRTWYRRRIVVPGSLLIAAMGLYWALQRIGF